MRYAVVENDVVVNIIEADSNYRPPKGQSLIESEQLSPGFKRVGGRWRDMHERELVDGEWVDTPESIALDLPPDPPTEEELYQRKLEAKKEEILRRMAEEELAVERERQP